MSKLPPRTEEEQRGIEMLQEYLDGADYTGETEWTASEEDARLMNLGYRRFISEELHGL